MPVAQLTDPDEAAFVARCEGLPPVEWPPAPPMRLWAALDERTPQGRKGLNVLLYSVKHQGLKSGHGAKARAYWLSRINEWQAAAAEHQQRLSLMILMDRRREREEHHRSKQG
jgi:hypothetical protein